jgi:hypothetical protein
MSQLRAIAICLAIELRALQHDSIGQLYLPLLLQITEEEQNFILQFLLSSGSLKEMASQMGNSYPTVRNKLDDLIHKVNQLKIQPKP